jgi:hypothetical protein
MKGSKAVHVQCPISKADMPLSVRRKMIAQFLLACEEHGTENKAQIVSLGSGLDSTFFCLAAKGKVFTQHPTPPQSCFASDLGATAPFT